MADTPAASKTPQLDELRKKLQQEKDRILNEVRPSRELYEKLMNAPELLEARNKIKASSKRLYEIENELAGMARSSGARALRAESGTITG